MARVEIQGLSKVFKGPQGRPVQALQDFTLAIADHELLVLVGPSGGGKTTALRLIAGLEQPTSGTISIDGRAMNAVEPKDRDVAMVFQHHALYPHMTVREQLVFPLTLRKVPGAERDRRVREIVELLELAPVLDRLPRALSGGERQRVALGRALVRRPKVLLLDEPLSNLDAPLRGRLRGDIAALHARLGTTMVYVTHDQAEALRLGQRLAVLRAGALQQVGEPLQVYRCPANLFVAGFIGSSPMNVFHGLLTAAEGGLCFEEEAPDSSARGFVRFRLPAAIRASLSARAGTKALLGLRPEAFSPCTAGSVGDSQSVVAVSVEALEPQGAETLARCTTGAHTFTVRLPSASTVIAGQKLSLAIDLNYARFFDPLTGQAVA